MGEECFLKTIEERRFTDTIELFQDGLIAIVNADPILCRRRLFERNAERPLSELKPLVELPQTSGGIDQRLTDRAGRDDARAVIRNGRQYHNGAGDFLLDRS